MTTLQGIILMLFAVCAAADFFALRSGNGRLEHAVKPALMPLLIALYLVSVPQPNPYVILALFGGFLGDTFLLGTGICFICGLLSFLVGHVFYITAFLRPLDAAQIIPALFLLVLPYLLYGILACRLLFPSIPKPMKPAVILYMVALLGMSFSALLRCTAVSGLRFWLTFLGSLFFVVSDTILAFQVFRKTSGKNSSVVVMATYLLAQLMITTGFIV